uniref:NADH-ubiquinone oxidoreductase chain 2 n=1 Tax=Zecheuna tonkinensis TaxID=2844956 RepID=A0A8H2SN04_9HEMI|nr:NADH dehydrogenase subunit 2 [Zecheuna tonkinensis]
MKINITKTTMISTMIMSTMASLSSNNFIFSWMMMEINMISFLPIMTKSNKMKDQTMKYFIIQSMASSMMLMSMLMNSCIETPINTSIMMMTSMLMKLGLIPFHIWMPMIMNSMTWENCMMMTTIQKIIPIMLSSQMLSTKMTSLPMIMSLMIAPMSAMKQLSMKKIMAFSSITNTPWMIMSMTNSKNQFMMFFMIYSTITIMIMKKFKKMNMMYVNQINMTKIKEKVSILILWMSMSGMPPTTGFIPKWFILQSTMSWTMTLSTTMIMSSMLTTFMYIKMISPMIMISSQTKKKIKKNKKDKDLSIILNMIGLPMMLMMKS